MLPVTGDRHDIVSNNDIVSKIAADIARRLRHPVCRSLPVVG
jgi:hypothetical protein